MKNFKILAVLCLVACMMLAIVGCKPVHEHDFSGDWANDANSHWKVCSGEECQEIAEKAAHTFGEGVETTPATEEAEGVMTYACTVCGYEKTEAIEKLVHEHSYSNEWSSDDNNHWHAALCGHDDKDVAPHIYDDGFIEKEATETETGVMVYTCVTCGYYYEEAIPVTSHTHTYSDEWSSDADNHWHAASCGHNVRKDKGAHEFGEGIETKAPTEEEEGILSYTCATCNYVKEVPIAKLPHTHKFATEWSKDADNHWYASLCGHDDTITKLPHAWNDGEITTQPTENDEGVKTFTCADCGQTKTQSIPSLSHTHTFETEYSKDSSHHWFASTCGHEDTIVKVAHSYDANGNCECGYHAMCELCGNCAFAGCTAHAEKCLFMDKSYLVHFAPQGNCLGAPEGPDGKAPGKAGAYLYDTTIVAGQIVLPDGTKATYVTSPEGTAAHSGVSLWNNKYVSEAGLAGYNCGLPQLANTAKPVRMHFVNLGEVEVTFKFSMIDYYWDKGAVTVTLAPGESKTVLMMSTHGSNTIGLNSQVVFPDGAEKGASIAIWGEFRADEIDNGISIEQSAKKLSYYVGETFTTEGLVLRAKSSTTYGGNAVQIYDRVYILQNYVTNYDGHTFTSADAGYQTVTVSFGGKTTTYTINVIDHGQAECPECGKCTNQVCTFPGCEERCAGHFDATKLVVMSFNLGTNGVNNAYNKSNLLAKLRNELPDLLGTQEENSIWTAAIYDTLAQYGYKNVIMYREGVTNADLGNEGAGIWYNALRFELNDWGYFWMSDTPEISSIWGKYGAQYKRVTTWANFTDKASGKTFTYFNTHIGYESEELWVATANMLMERMHDEFNKGNPVIITGDFNFAINTEGALEPYNIFAGPLNDSHYEAIVKNYEIGKENTFSEYGKYQGAGTEAGSDVLTGRKHVKPIDYIFYSNDFVAQEYWILREELPEGATAGTRDYFSSDHFAIKTLFTFADSWGQHYCWEPCAKCGLCLDDECEICTEKCLGHHKCDTFCPDCGLCANLDGECEAEHCVGYKITLSGATFADGTSVKKGCKVSGVVLAAGKTFEGFLDAQKNYYADAASIELTGDIKLTALYQEDMIAWAQSDTKSSAEPFATAKHIFDNGIYKTSITFLAGAPAGTWFAGRGSKDSGSMPLNWCAPANGKNVGIVYIYNHSDKAVTIQYMTENYGPQNAELIVELQPGLNRIVLTFGTAASYNSFYACDHQIILKEDLAEEVTLTTYGYIFNDGFVEDVRFDSTPTKVAYKIGETFDASGLKLGATIKGYKSTYITNPAIDYVGKVFTAEDIGIHTVTVTYLDYTFTFEIEVVEADCENGIHAYVENANPVNFKELCGTDAIYNVSCKICGAKGEETFAMEKVLFTPHTGIGGGHKIEIVTLEDGRLAAKLTFNSDMAAGSKVSITASKGIAGTNVHFPVRGAGRILYLEMLSSADITLGWNPEYYGDADRLTLELTAGEAKGGVWLVKYDTTSNGSDNSALPYQEIYAGSDIPAGTVVYLTGYFYTYNEVTAVSAISAASKLTFKIGDTFSANGLSFKPTATDSLFGNVVIYNFTTNLDGHVFTAEDVGIKTVTVNVCGIEYTYEIEITGLLHNLEEVPQVDPIPCEKDGVKKYWICTDEGCGKLYDGADWTVANEIAAPEVISCHTAPAYVLPGEDVLCTGCSKVLGNTDGVNWVQFAPPTTADIGSNINNGKIEFGTVNGMPGTIFYIGAGTKGATNYSSFHLHMSDNEAGHQTVLPNLTTAVSGLTRTIVLYFENYSDEAITMNFQNDSGGSKGACKVTIPANGSIIGQFTMSHSGGSNWFHFYVDCNPTQDVSFGMYGYFYVNEGEIDSVALNSASAQATTFKVGDSFDANGLILDSQIIGSRPLYITTGYTTNLDGYTFTADDIGKKSVVVYFAGKETTYEIEVTE